MGDGSFNSSAYNYHLLSLIPSHLYRFSYEEFCYVIVYFDCSQVEPWKLCHFVGIPHFLICCSTFNNNGQNQYYVTLCNVCLK